MTTLEQINELQALADKHKKYLKLAFLAAVVQLRNSTDNAALEYAISINSIEGIFRAIEPEQLDNLLHGIGMDKKNIIFSDESIAIFNLAAALAFTYLPKELQLKWNYNPIGEKVVATMIADAARIASELTESTMQGLTATVLRSLSESLDIASKAKEIKQLIGLTEPQAQAVLNFRRQLEARKQLGFTAAQDRKFTPEQQLLIRQHMKSGTLTEAGIDRLVKIYYENLLNSRAEQIALAGAMNAINAGMQGMWQQGLDQGIFDARDRKFWYTAGDNKVRPTHKVIPSMNAQGVPINSMFITPTGLVPYPMWGMGDYVHCRCIVVLERI